MDRQRVPTTRLVALAALTLASLARVPAEAVSNGLGVTRVDVRAHATEDLRTRVRTGSDGSASLRAAASPGRGAPAPQRTARRPAATARRESPPPPSTTHRPGTPSGGAVEGRRDDGGVRRGPPPSAAMREAPRRQAWRAGRMPASPGDASVAALAEAFYDAHAPPPFPSVVAGHRS